MGWALINEMLPAAQLLARAWQIARAIGAELRVARRLAHAIAVRPRKRRLLDGLGFGFGPRDDRHLGHPGGWHAMTTTLGWVLAVPLAVMFVVYGGAKLTGSAAMVGAFRSFGYDAPAPRLVVGAVEVVAGAALLVPPLRGVAALVLLVGLAGCIGDVVRRRRRQDLGPLRAPLMPVAVTLVALAAVAALGLAA